MFFSRRLALAAFFVMPFFTVMSAAEATPLYIKGDVVYRERIALPENAQLEVTLSSAATDDSAANVIATTTFMPTVSSPIPYELKFDSSAIRPDETYELSARIMVGDKVFFTTLAKKTIFGDEENDTQILVGRASSTAENTPATDTGSTPATDAENTPVVAPQEVQNINALTGEWVIVSISGKTVNEQVPATLSVAENGRINGKSGCNSFGGNVEVKNAKLAFGPVVSTKMACRPELMKQETDLFQTFPLITGYSTTDEGLTLLDADNNPVLVLSRKK